MAMSRFPEVQSKARAELDAVIGCDRVPTLADRERLPYLNAVYLEVLRWIPVAPMGQSVCSMSCSFSLTGTL